MPKLRDGADAAEIARYLEDVARGAMGLSYPSESPSFDAVARLIVDWYPSSIEWWQSRK